MLSATCHCGAVRIEVPQPPQKLTICNCSICRRYGALWAYYKAGTVRVTGHPENTTEYVWGDKTLRTIRCRNCGCVTHWIVFRARAWARTLGAMTRVLAAVVCLIASMLLGCAATERGFVN